MENIIDINKAQIGKLDFSGNDPRTTDLEKKQRLTKLNRAVKLNANDSTIVSIILKDKTRGLFRVKSKINMVSLDNISLRGSKLIPIKAVWDITFI